MRSKLLFLLMLFLWAQGCAGPTSGRAPSPPTTGPVETPDRYTEAALASMLTQSVPGGMRQYYQGDGLGQNLLLTLLPGGHYTVTWHGCEGLYGAAVGTWRLSDGDVTLEPVEERGWFIEHPLRVLHVRIFQRRPLLVPQNQMTEFQVQGATRTSCFQDIRTITDW